MNRRTFLHLLAATAAAAVAGLRPRPPQLDAVAVGATLALIGGLCVAYRGWELGEER